jgi:aminoglycoside 2''-phosphotransferase
MARPRIDPRSLVAIRRVAAGHAGPRGDRVVELGRGADSVAYLVDEEWVVRVARTANARVTMRREIALLPELAAALPVAVPDPAFVETGEGGAAFMGYRVLRGVPLTPALLGRLPRRGRDRVLGQFAEFLRALHGHDIAAARRAGVGPQLLTGGYHPGQRELLDLAAPCPGNRRRKQLEVAFDAIEADPGSTFIASPAVLHADLKPAHVLVDPSGAGITGILDWGDVSLGDPDFDLAVISIFFGRGVLAQLLRHLPGRDAEALEWKAGVYSALRALQDQVFGLRTEGLGGTPG